MTADTETDVEEQKYPDPKRFKAASVWLGGSGVTIVSIISWVEIFVVALLAAILMINWLTKTA